MFQTAEVTFLVTGNSAIR